jgi:hypothetical protein
MDDIGEQRWNEAITGLRIVITEEYPVAGRWPLGTIIRYEHPFVFVRLDGEEIERQLRWNEFRPA